MSTCPSRIQRNISALAVRPKLPVSAQFWTQRGAVKNKTRKKPPPRQGPECLVLLNDSNGEARDIFFFYFDQQRLIIQDFEQIPGREQAFPISRPFFTPLN